MCLAFGTGLCEAEGNVYSSTIAGTCSRLGWTTVWSGSFRCGWAVRIVDRRRTECTSERHEAQQSAADGVSRTGRWPTNHWLCYIKEGFEGLGGRRKEGGGNLPAPEFSNPSGNRLIHINSLLVMLLFVNIIARLVLGLGKFCLFFGC
jgi:hypothetical protein